MQYKNGLFIFSNDLRVQDNKALAHISSKVLRLACLWVMPANTAKPNRYTCLDSGTNKTSFLFQALHELDEALAQFNQQLHLLTAANIEPIVNYVLEHEIEYVVMSRSVAPYEAKLQAQLKAALSAIGVQIDFIWQHTLLEQKQLPFEIEALPASFSKFRRLLEKSLDFDTIPQVQKIVSLPPIISVKTQPIDVQLHDKAPAEANVIAPFHGGCLSANTHLQHYFSSLAPLTYKETRNALDEWSSSTKLSPYLALGNLSVHQCWQKLNQYENKHGANESTYWIKFEWLWREYFHWYLFVHQSDVFKFSGLSETKPLTNFSGERFAKWCQGNTPYPLINAIMNQLNQTGYISNRARQIAASCWVHECKGDWRYGAAYFEQQLIDYDVAANWGNWQYIAGVGADPRGGRWFNIEKQAQQFDPEGHFIKKWQGDREMYALDSVDIADWPVS